MEQRTFGNTGLPVSPLGFGAAPIGFLETEQQQIGDILNALLDAGVTLIDTAAAYSGSEEAIGKAVASRRGEYVLVSKCGQKFDGLPGEAWSPDAITATVDRSLKRLQTDHLDVMLLHSCGKDVLEKGDALGALVAARDAGKIRFAGYSGDNATVAYAAGLPEIAVVETSINLVDQANIDGVLPIAIQHGIGVIAKRPVANAAWKPQDQQPGFYQAYAKDYHERFQAIGLALEEFDVADWSELALRFTLSIPGVHTAIIGTTKLANAEKNIAIAEKGPLPEPAVNKIRAAFAKAGGDSWPGLT